MEALTGNDEPSSSCDGDWNNMTWIADSVINPDHATVRSIGEGWACVAGLKAIRSFIDEGMMR